MLKLSDAAYKEVRRHGEETYPHECCGVLLGLSLGGAEASVNEASVNQVEAVVRASNTRTDSAHNRYQISPHELVKIQRDAREKEQDIVGFYHSHPDHPARWSPTDFAEAHWLGCSYVITSVEHGKAVVTNSFLLAGSGEQDKRFEDEEIQVEQPVAGG
jgi:proteasome lid subunit RPN8/RPN11